MEAAHALIEAYHILLNSVDQDNITQIKEQLSNCLKM